MSSLLFKNAIILDPNKKKSEPGELLIVEGKIAAIDSPGKIPQQSADRTIDLNKKYLLPGLIDAHVHFREPGLEYKETLITGGKAALAGGFTTVACMANTNPVNDTPYVTAFIREKAKTSSPCRIFPIGALSKGLKGLELAEIGGMIEEGAIAISDDGMPVMNSYLMRKAMDYAKAFNVPIISHAEDAHLVRQGVINEGALSNELGLRGNPSAAEEIMVAREIALCRLTKCRTHIAHVTTALAVEHIRRAKEEGLPITAEVTPHHLSLIEDDVRTYHTQCKMAPPLRTAEDRESLINALASGVIDIIATDHAPHAIIEKVIDFDQAAFGIIGLQSAIPITYNLVREGKISEKRWIEALSIRPAQILNLPYGSLKIGSVADVTIFDPQKEWAFKEESNFSKSKNSPFLNWNFKGRIDSTLIEGKFVS